MRLEEVPLVEIGLDERGRRMAGSGEHGRCVALCIYLHVTLAPAVMHLRTLAS